MTNAPLLTSPQLHTREVAGSIPAGTTRLTCTDTVCALYGWFVLSGSCPLAVVLTVSIEWSRSRLVATWSSSSELRSLQILAVTVGVEWPMVFWTERRSAPIYRPGWHRCVSGHGSSGAQVSLVVALVTSELPGQPLDLLIDLEARLFAENNGGPGGGFTHGEAATPAILLRRH
jgi:hypothetical protein